MIFGAAIPLFLLGPVFLIGGRRLIDMLSGTVSRVEGRATKFVAPGSKEGRVVYYSVGKEDIQIAWNAAWKALHSETMVRAYYTPLSKTLVNVEPIYSQSNAAQSARGYLEQDPDLDGLQWLEKAEIKSKKQKQDSSGD